MNVRPMANATRRVLMLHGYTQNASIFRKRVGAIRKACGEDVEFVFVDAPHILKPADIAGRPWLIVDEGSFQFGAEDPSLVPRAWWTYTSDTKVIGLEKTLVMMRDLLKVTRCHGVFGFSQGAALAALLCALLEKPNIYPEFMVDGQAPHPPFEFCISISGFRVVDPISNAAFANRYCTPTLHVSGKNDTVIPEERTWLLVEISENRRVESHDGGHFVPSKASWRKFLCDYLRNPLADLPSPSQPAAVSSGMNTPTDSMKL